MLQAFTQSRSAADNATAQTHSPDYQRSSSRTASFREDCLEVVFSDMDYLPWNNSDNIVNAEVEEIARHIQFNSLGLLFLIGGPANVINMAVFYKQGLKDRVNLCLFALSLSDLLFLVYFMFSFGEQLHLQFTTKDEYGPMTTFTFNHNLHAFMAFGYVSGIISAIIATERCLCVFNPIKFQRLLRTRTMAAIIAAAYLVVPGFFFFVVSQYHVQCIYDPTSGEVVMTLVEGEFYQAHKQFIDYLDTVIYGGALPGTVLTVVTTTTILTIVKLRQIVTWRSESSSSISTSELVLTKMLVVNSILFIVCFSPDPLNHFIRHFIPEMRSGGRYHNLFLTVLWICDVFTFFNATLNIFVYYAMGSRFRKTFWLLFSRKLRPSEMAEMLSVKTK